MIKKIFWLSLGFFVLTLVFLGVYTFAFKNNVNDPVADPEKYAAHQAEQEKLQAFPTTSLAFELVFPDTVLFPRTEKDQLFYYSLRDQSFKSFAFDTRETKTILQNVPGTVKRVLWAPNLIGVLAYIEDNQGLLWRFIDFRDQTVTLLRPEMSRLSWNTLGDGIYYLYTDPATGAQSINTASFNGTNWKKLTDVERGDYFVSNIPQSSQAAFWTKPDGFTQSRLESISLTGEGRTELFSGRYGADYSWSPNGRLILVSSGETQASHQPSLGLLSEAGGDYQDLKVPTLINKVTWSKDNQTLYYAQPNTFPSGTVLPNDYYAKPITTIDTFWKMDIKTGKRKRLIPLNEMKETFDATDLFLSHDETKLYFLDRSSHKLYRISL